MLVWPGIKAPATERVGRLMDAFFCHALLLRSANALL